VKSKVKVTEPTDQEQESNLNEVIEEEYAKGGDTLMPGDQSLLEHNIVQLLSRTTAYKIGWVTRIGVAHQRVRRKRVADDEATVLSKQASTLYKWLKAPCQRPTKRQRTTFREAEEQEPMTTEQGVWNNGARL
jgi:hypothetical protein